MGKCIKCNAYTKDSYKYCKKCYENTSLCEFCNQEINTTNMDEFFIKNNYILCIDCFRKYALNNDSDLRKIYETKYRAKDGHYVRSKNELIIDNFLFDHRIIHEYEKVIFDPNDSNKEFYSDFYLPDYDVFIEFWGLIDDKDYLKKMNEKQKLYKQNNLKLISLYEENIKNIDDHLNKELMQYIKD